MRHLKKGKKLSRERDQRRALLKSLAHSVIMHGRIKTTLAKAKAAAPLVERLINKGKKGDLAARREVLKVLPPASVKRLMEKVVPEFRDRKGGYTRITRAGIRKSDGSQQAIFELTKV